MTTTNELQKQINDNKKIHDNIFAEYDDTHTEIFNDLEQARLLSSLKMAVNLVKTASTPPLNALDFGCGSGNLTKHLISLGLITTASDLSEKFLDLVKKLYANTGLLNTLLINGQDLSNISDNTYDLVATYSVLHHVPDYLSIIKEMVRVLKHGGILYLDHERNDEFWQPSSNLQKFMALTKPNFFNNWQKFFKPAKYVTGIKKLFNSRYQPEGDIHVWPDDHIDWQKIEQLLNDCQCEVVLKSDYLLFDSKYSLDVYNEYKDKCTDMRAIVARKKA